MDWLTVDEFSPREIPPILAHKFKQRKELERAASGWRLRGTNFFDHVSAVDEERRVVLLAQGRMQGRTVLGLVDFFASEKRCNPAGQSDRIGVRDQQRQRLGTETLLRQIDEPIVPAKRQSREPVGIGREQLGERAARQRPAMACEICGSGVGSGVHLRDYGNTETGAG